MTYWAKPDQSYQEHVENCFRAWEETVCQLRPTILRGCADCQVSEERFLQSSLLTVALHDTGKMIEEFQLAMEDRRKGKRPDFDDYYRHELASFPFVMLAALSMARAEPLWGRAPLEACAVVAHHKLLNPDLRQFDRERQVGPPRFIPAGIQEALGLAEALFAGRGWSLPRPDYAPVYKDSPYSYLAKLLGETGMYGTHLYQTNQLGEVRRLYSLLKGVLHCADWHASGGAKVRLLVRLASCEIEDITRAAVEAKGRCFGGWTTFQQQSGSTQGNVLACAPTGSGKTEASLLWAAQNLQEDRGGKLLYLLPTMVTANAIFDRLCGFFGPDSVALSHSSANLFLDSKAEEYRWDSRRDLLFHRAFVRPVSVATVDQLLTTGFNSRHWTLKETAASSAGIIIDEIHAYEPWTLGLIVSAIRHYTAMGARFFVMSATLPRFLRKELADALTPMTDLADTSLLEASPSRYFVKNCQIEDDLMAVREAVQDGHRVLVVVNTVKRCQDLAKALEDLKPVCYHSKFIFRDRVKKEKELPDAHLVVATQVVEVSLDIDFDWMFTECAPPDALVQRAGRINRKRDNDRDSRLFVYPASDCARNIYDPAGTGLLDRSLKAFRQAGERLRESDLLEIVDASYSDFSLQESQDYQEALGLYQRVQDQRLGIYDSRLQEDELEKVLTRKTTYHQVDVIPDVFLDKAVSVPPGKRRLYELKMPLWYVQRKRYHHDGITFCRMRYDEQFGATFDETEDVSQWVF